MNFGPKALGEKESASFFRLFFNTVVPMNLFFGSQKYRMFMRDDKLLNVKYFHSNHILLRRFKNVQAIYHPTLKPRPSE